MVSHRGYYINPNTAINIDTKFVPCPPGLFRRYMFVPLVGDYLTLESLLQAMFQTVQAGEGIGGVQVDDTRLGGVWFQFIVTEEGLIEPRQHLEAVADLEKRILGLMELINLDRGFTRCQAGVFRRFMFVPLTGYYFTQVSLLQAMLSTVRAGEGISATGIDVMRAGGVWFRFDVVEEGLIEPRLRLEAMAELKMRILRVVGI
ncbi:hypothetical protein P168DRAFT_329133 [Aspergillus campestris IBT 28561]|uniref:Uncharacterized protein n=1 Tax=Aspergillus campestris (strain IBT 28561) TaxID=1392248 RepID=A0A2I1CX12_ASPC2|nr:uncharacterized protein P168DRAFT_329133 [Aspergillus campestris IBT 28561]PKY02168.1 hypothetical protein P168DRAFT_329133 [Aspergillus campestris IBT 28561]